VHHAGAVVRSPPHHILVPGWPKQCGERRLVMQSPPPSDPQGRVAHPNPSRRALVHPPAPHRPTPTTAQEFVLSGVNTFFDATCHGAGEFELTRRP
jgi:hypothetical protein